MATPNTRTRNVQHDIEGKPYRIDAIMDRVRATGTGATRHLICYRLRSGANTWAQLLAPVNTQRSKQIKSGHQRKRDEMAELLARMGPPRIY